MDIRTTLGREKTARKLSTPIVDLIRMRPRFYKGYSRFVVGGMDFHGLPGFCKGTKKSDQV